MLQDVPAQSNAERQRRFRERNPGYYARIQATKRASAKRGAALLFAQHMAEHPDAFPAATSDVAAVTAVVEIIPATVELAPAIPEIAPPMMMLASPAFEVVDGSPDVFLRIFPATSDAIAA